MSSHRETALKTEIHPTYETTTVTCSCGNTFETKSTKPGDMHIELCNECHPFFTGKQKVVDSGGRVERFQRRYGKSTFTKAGETGEGSEEETADAE
jgi:large subunit ribosomal protein L31